MSLAAAPYASAPARAGFARWEPIAASLCLAQFSEPLFAAIAQSQGATEPPEYARIFFLPVYAFLIFVLWRDRAKAWTAFWATPLLAALLTLAFASTLWSIDSGGTLRRSVWLAATMSFALYLAWRYGWRDLIQVIAGGYVVMIAGSFATALLAPNVGVMQSEHVGAWSGLWTHKNMLGGIMALGVPIGAAAAIVAPERRKLWLGVAFGAFALVLLSTSKTALLASVIGLAVMAAGAFARRGPLQTIAVIAIGCAALVIAASVALFDPDLMFAALGRDASLTGRTDIWSAAAPAVAAHPWFGYGYYVFWLPDLGPAYWVRQAVEWPVQSAHSGWLELALGMGRLGVTLFALQLIATIARGTIALKDARAGLWAPAFLAAFALYTISESHVMQANDVFWTIYVAVAARLALDARERRRA